MVNYKSIKLSPGLYFVSTPIGTARDITLRALDILASVDVLAAEDTRTLKKLLEIHGIQLKNRTLISYHDHNGSKIRPKKFSITWSKVNPLLMHQKPEPL